MRQIPGGIGHERQRDGHEQRTQPLLQAGFCRWGSACFGGAQSCQSSTSCAFCEVFAPFLSSTNSATRLTTPYCPLSSAAFNVGLVRDSLSSLLDASTHSAPIGP